MRKGTCAAVAALALAGIPETAFAQAASEDVKKQCQAAANDIAKTYMAAKKRGVKDMESGVYKPSTNWAEQVAHYMAQAMSRSDSLSEKELATLGATYCVERRPTGR